MKTKQIVLTGATVIDGTGGPPRKNEAVLIGNGLICQTGDPTTIRQSAPDAFVMDLSGMYLTPGFINVHDHLFNRRKRGTAADYAIESRDMLLFRSLRNAFTSLLEGITTIRDAGSKESVGIDVRDALNTGLFMGPEIQAVSQGLTVTGGYVHQLFLEVDSVVDVRKAVGEMIKRDVDWVKCMASIEWNKAAGEPVSAVNISTELMREAFSIAHHHGKRCMAHAVCNESIINALDAGVDSIEHGVMLDQPTADRMARDNVFFVPTLSSFREKCNDWGRGTGAMKHGALMRPYHDKAIQFARNSGVRMAFGSDNFGNLVDEMNGLHELGFSLPECLAMATRNGAQLLGIEKSAGTIEPGKRADLVVLGSDPLSRPQAFGDVRLVFCNGQKVDPSQLSIFCNYE